MVAVNGNDYSFALQILLYSFMTSLTSSFSRTLFHTSLLTTTSVHFIHRNVSMFIVFPCVGYKVPARAPLLVALETREAAFRESNQHINLPTRTTITSATTLYPSRDNGGQEGTAEVLLWQQWWRIFVWRNGHCRRRAVWPTEQHNTIDLRRWPFRIEQHHIHRTSDWSRTIRQQREQRIDHTARKQAWRSFW